MPFLILVHLLFRSRSRCQRRKHIHTAPRASAETLRLAHFHRADGEVGCGVLSFKGSPCSCFISCVNLRLCLSGGKGAALIIGVVYADKIRCAVCLVAESETDIHQSATPTAPCQLVRTPVHIHRQIEVTGFYTVYLKRLFVTGWRMQYHVIIHKPAVEIAVTRMNARILLRLKRAFLYQFLPHAIIGTEIDVLKKLSIELFVDDT